MTKHLKITVLLLVLFVTFSISAEEWMPDPALREAVRETLGIPADSNKDSRVCNIRS